MENKDSSRSQSDRFKKTARELRVDLNVAKLADILRRVVKHEHEKKPGDE